MQQMLLEKDDLRYIKSRTHGGSSLKKRRKVARPLVPGAITHLVLKSTKARGDLSFYRNKKAVHSLLKDKCRDYFIELIDYVNMGNHLHLKVRFKDAQRFKNFLRAFCGQLPRKLTQAHRGAKFGRFWDGLAYTRVLLSKFEEFGLRIYFVGNHRQKELSYAARVEYLKKWNRFLYKLKSVRAAPT